MFIRKRRAAELESAEEAEAEASDTGALGRTSTRNESPVVPLGFAMSFTNESTAVGSVTLMLDDCPLARNNAKPTTERPCGISRRADSKGVGELKNLFVIMSELDSVGMSW